MSESARAGEHVIGMLRADHGHIKEHLSRLGTVEKSEQDRILAELFLDLRILSIVEQQLFYPCLAPQIDRQHLSELGKELYFMLTLMLELESTYASSQSLQSTLTLLSERFEQHVKKDEGLFNQFDKWASDWRLQVGSLSEKMEAYRGELKNKLSRKMPDSNNRFTRPVLIRTRCA